MRHLLHVDDMSFGCFQLAPQLVDIFGSRTKHLSFTHSKLFLLLLHLLT